MNAHVQRVAHRGGSQLAPENTLAAFRNALTMPIDAIELDVQMSRDGHLVVFHDATVERLTDGEGNMLDLDFAYLRSLNAAAHFPVGWPQAEHIPTLDEVLNLAKSRVQVYIEVKASERDGVYGRYPQIAEMIIHNLRTTKMLDQVRVISFDWCLLEEIRSLEPKVQTGAIVSQDVWAPQAEWALETLIEQVQSRGCRWVNMDRKLFTTEMPTVLHKHDLKLGIWTVNTLEELQSLGAAGVDSLTTDRPDLFAQM